ncbi:aldehyde dehydrogenase (NADP(+)) [Kineosporia rhizophila]|uniref:aldehyde dehydrogenase (NADP(+)) n=1 Tax=Kineosporia TaxID=49184 RepID=UPI001E559091|nr:MULTISPECIES: aldehyde dehydrogenase (NADP(+)) [Kineosporia]MCE0534174.1 aldehyde dehydrogenase (NADP(+)) [Kineosporia rhizophila]GLY13720.1 2,5-dioxovalerate dehydrogenase [Kineosporia sp. NBRC 101677]
MPTVELTGEMLIGASAVLGSAGTVTGRDPRTGEELKPTYGLGGSAEVDRAAELAWAAFGTYRQTDGEQRAAFLDRIAANLEAVAEPLVARVIAETGIAEPRVRGELARTVNQLRLFGRVLREGSWIGARIEPPLPDRKPLPRPDLRQRKIPLGPVAVFGASNFPLAFSVAGGDTASALAAGCPVIVKAHSSHPGTSEIVGRAIQSAVAESGLPEGVFSLLYGGGSSLGTALVAHPRVRAVGFTGSRSGGLALAATAAARPVPIPVYAEMSSVNPVFLLPSALEAAPEALGASFVTSLTTGVGQLCTNPGLVFAVDSPALDAFLSAASAAVSSSAAAPMLSRGICAAYGEGAQRYAGHPQVKAVADGLTDDSIDAPGVAHLYTTSGSAFLSDHTLHEEVFGATSLVVRLEDVSQLPSVVEALEGQLTASVHANDDDLEVAGELLPELELKVGRVIFNGWPTGVDVGQAMVHGGPFPSTYDGRSTSVGTLAIERFLRPVAYQDLPAALRPAGLDDANELGIFRQLDGQFGRD